MGLLEGERALVTGGASGIGAATARAMVAEGARVAVIDRDAAGAEAVADEIGGLAVTADVADADALRPAFDRAAEWLGGLTVVFNNAGIGFAQAPAHLHAGRGRPAGGRQLQGHLQRRGRGGARCCGPVAAAAIVNMASVSGLRPTRGEAPYAAAKAAVIALTKSAALEYGPDGIRVNCVSPGFIRTRSPSSPSPTPPGSNRSRPPRRSGGPARPRTWPKWWSSWPARGPAT